MNKQKKKTHNVGGKRKGAGRKPLFDEPTGSITFRLPLTQIAHIKKQDGLNQKVHLMLKKEFPDDTEDTSPDASPPGV